MTRGMFDWQIVHSSDLCDAHHIGTRIQLANYLMKYTPWPLCSMDCNDHKSCCISLQCVLNTTIIVTPPTGSPQSRRKKFSEFSRLFQSHKLTFPWVIATKSKCNNELQQGSFHINSSNMILFTQSTAVLHKYLTDELKILLFVTNFPQGCTEFPKNSLSFPRSEKSLSIPGFPGLWPPCPTILLCQYLLRYLHMPNLTK